MRLELKDADIPAGTDTEARSSEAAAHQLSCGVWDWLSFPANVNYCSLTQLTVEHKEQLTLRHGCYSPHSAGEVEAKKRPHLSRSKFCFMADFPYAVIVLSGTPA